MINSEAERRIEGYYRSLIDQLKEDIRDLHRLGTRDVIRELEYINSYESVAARLMVYSDPFYDRTEGKHLGVICVGDPCGHCRANPPPDGKYWVWIP